MIDHKKGQGDKIRVIAMYLPQFHPTPENDEWWGRGYTEWVSVANAKPLFPGHYQPRVPADLGFYDLRLPESREAQASLAREYGIEGFCYWHYWFGNGKQLLERPFNEVLESGKPDFPFCLAWANHPWYKKLWGSDHNDDKLLIDQLYPGDEDYEAHFYNVLPAFRDERYIQVDGKPLFMIFVPFKMPDAKHFIDIWTELAIKNGLKGIYFVGQCINHSNPDAHNRILDMGFDAVNPCETLKIHSIKNKFNRGIMKVAQKYLHIPRVYKYRKAMRYFIAEDGTKVNIFPTLFPNWDHSPRSGSNGVIFHDSMPDFFKEHCKQVFEQLKEKPFDKRLVFIKSWNEWGEGNYIEPDQRFGHGYLQALKEAIDELEIDR